MALNTTRDTGWSFSAFLDLRISSTCHEIASPSRSGSVARISRSAPLTAAAISERRLPALLSISQSIRKSASGSTEPSFAGRSRTWP